MRYRWAKGVAALMVAAALGGSLAGCNRAGASGEDPRLAENLRAAEEFMASNAKAEGVQTLPSGIQYKVIQSGPPGGEIPDGNDLVRIDYEGALLDGTVFDSSFQAGKPTVFTVDQVVPGFRDALQHMRVGDEWYVYIPPALGYGEQDKGDIPPNSALVFRLKLHELARNPGGDSGVDTAVG